MPTIDFDKFTDEQKESYQERLRTIDELIDGYKKENPAFAEQSLHLKNVIGELNLFFSRGRQAWFSQYRNVIENYFLKNGFTGVRNAIVDEFNLFWTELPLDDKIWVSGYGDKFCYMPNIYHRSPEALIKGINEELKRALKKLYPKLLLEDVTNGHENSVTFYVHEYSDIPLFKVTSKESKITVDKLYRTETTEILEIETYLLRIIVGQVNYRY